MEQTFQESFFHVECLDSMFRRVLLTALPLLAACSEPQPSSVNDYRPGQICLDAVTEAGFKDIRFKDGQ